MSLPKKKGMESVSPARMMLHDVPRSPNGIWVRVVENGSGPPGSPGFKAGDKVLYYGLDGMYSTCKNQAGEAVYLKAWAEVEVIGAEDG